MTSSGYRDVDLVLTTRELARLIKESGLDFKALPEESADDMMGLYSGARPSFLGASGGVMEAALRTVLPDSNPERANRSGNPFRKRVEGPQRDFSSTERPKIESSGGSRGCPTPVFLLDPDSRRSITLTIS